MMTIENANSTDHDIDGSDVLGSLDITSIKQRSIANAAWVSGMMGGHRFEALVFPEHAENPDYEIDDSRISKLWVQRIEDRATVYNWDRGQDIEPATPIAAKIVGLLVAGLADHIYGE